MGYFIEQNEDDGLVAGFFALCDKAVKLGVLPSGCVVASLGSTASGAEVTYTQGSEGAE